MQAAEPADLLKQTRVDYAQLFMGPPRPLAAPWETVYVLDWYLAFVEAVTEKTAHSFYGYLVQIIAGCLQWSAKNIIMDV
nr:molecular chaperone TorD family protein [Selenomonas ruminantium]